MKHGIRVVLHWALLAHIYVSMAGFTLAVLFGATGLTLNHDDFGFSDPRITRATLALDKDLVDNPDQTKLEQCLREKLSIRSPTVDYHDDIDQIQITFAAPGERTTVSINPADGSAEVEKETRGLLAKLGDLHKGSDAGNVWHWTIDVAALLLITSSLTGMVTLLALRARRRTGFTIGVLGVFTVIVIYVMWVPK